MSQTADESVSRRKFDREVGRLRASERVLTARGIWVVEAEFPYVKIAFLGANMAPPMIMALAVRVDYTDYDVRPFSVKFWHPFADREMLTSEMQTMLPRRLALPPEEIVKIEVADGDPAPDAAAASVPAPVTNLVQSHGPTLPAFLCLAGTREYHDHPAHTGDAWELHRRTDGAALFELVETLWRYGSAPLTSMGFQLALMVQQSEIPA